MQLNYKNYEKIKELHFRHSDLDDYFCFLYLITAFHYLNCKNQNSAT